MDTQPPHAELESLEGRSTTVVHGNGSPAKSPSTPAVPPKLSLLKKITKRFNLYLLLFALVILIAMIVITIALITNHQANNTTSVSTQSLTQQQLDQLAKSDVSVGTNKQILNVQSNAVFAGQVLIRQDLEVAGTIKAGGPLNLPGIIVSGTSSFSQIETGTLTVSGNTAVQGQLTASGNLNVSGKTNLSGAVSTGQLTVSSLTLNGDLNLDHHVSAGGSTPSRSSGSALGNGGTTSLNGSDTAGSITINTGTGPSAGCFITVTFATKFNATPHAIVTPIGSSAGGIPFYVNRSTTNFSICTTAAPPASSSFGFDYIVFD
jgi:cytoskeletal protein CcmA (bactofilin family)